MRQGRSMLLAASAGALGLTALLRRFPPDRYPVYPACPFHAATGLLCPGCGATRALAALLEGHLRQALHWNALFVGLLPLLAGYGLAALWTQRQGGSGQIPRIPGPALSVLAAVAVAFTVWRNLALP